MLLLNMVGAGSLAEPGQKAMTLKKTFTRDLDR